MNKRDLILKMDTEHTEEVSEQSVSMDSLHDDILIHILSFLPIKEAVLTSVLSKRWRTLFAFTHNLEFGNLYYYPCRDEVEIFWDFVDRILALRGGIHVKKFSVNHQSFCNYDYERVGEFINYVLKHSVSDIDLWVPGDTDFISRKFRDYLQRVFTSTTLVKLSLGKSFSIDSLHSDIYLPSLKVLLLDEIGFKHGLSDVFFAACPALEDLTINFFPSRNCSYTISSKTIKKLSFSNYDSDVTLKDFVFETPNVVDLYYLNYPCFILPKHCQFDLLVKATLDLGFLDYQTIKGNIVECVKNLLTGIRNVKTLHLHISTVKLIMLCCKDGLLIPVFNNLVHLRFEGNKQGWRVVLPHLLECSPNLKVLVLSELHRYTFNRRRFVGIQIPLENQIEILRIKYFRGSANELRLISHFLSNMKCLKVVEVCVDAIVDDPKKMQLTEDLLKFPTASSEVKIQVI